MRPRFFFACRSVLLAMTLLQLVSNHALNDAWAASPDQPAGKPYNQVERTRHNLGLSSGQACIFCHTTGAYNPSPPDAVAQEASVTPPLWDESSTVKSYRGASFGSPGPSSACLACHDDALATGLHGLNHPIEIGYPRQPDGHFVAKRTGPDVVRFWSVPDRTASGVSLPTGPHSAYLSLPTPADAQNQAATEALVRTTAGSVHCDSCHNPHNSGIAPFLRENPKTLCLICHDR